MNRWVIGRGLLGSAIVTELGGRVHHSTIRWANPVAAISDLNEAAELFSRQGTGDWEVYWSAGRGVTSTPRDTMIAEANVFESFLESLSRHMGERMTRGKIFLASSVGGAYAGAVPPFTESTRPAPRSIYGEVKLRMEEALRGATSSGGARAFIARVTNLYGPGQDLAKGQGLVSAIIEGSITGRPTSIYVSLDTLRDYIFVSDCARVVVAGVRRLDDCPAGETVVKIVGAMNAVSIGALLGEVARVRRRPVPLVLGQGDSTGQASDLRVRSEVWTDLDGLVATTLPEGLGALYRARLLDHIYPAE